MKIFNNIMGNSPSISGRPTEAAINVSMPDLPRLSDNNNYSHWRILLHAYLDVLGLWAGKAPVDSPQSKFVLLSTLETWLVVPSFEFKTAPAIFKVLEEGYGSNVEM